MADSEFGGFFDTVKPVLKSDLAGSTSSDPFMPKFGGGSSLPGLGRSGGLGRGLKKPGKGGLMNVDKASDSYFGQNLKTLDSLGGINGYQASSYSFTAKDTTGQGLNNPELQAALKEMAGSDVFIQDDAGNAVPDATKPKPVPAQSEPAQSEPAQSEPAQSEPAQSEPAQQTSLQLADGVTYQPNINGRDKRRGRTFAVSGKSVSTGNPYDAGQVVESDNPYDNGQRSNAENEWYDNAVRKLSKNMYGIDIDSLEIDDVNGQHIDNPVLDSWKGSLREFIRLNNEAHRRKLSKKEVEAWQAAGNSAYDMQNALRTYSTMMSTHAIPADADSSEVWNDAANAIVAMDKDKLDKYFPGLYESNLYGAAMKQAQAGDVSQLESISQLLQPVIDSRKAAEEPGDPGTVFFSRDFWRWAYDTAGAALVRGFENVKGFSKDLYYRARINDDDEPMTEAERAENEQLKAARDFNLRETQFADEWADQEMQRANDASEVYKTQELIRRGRDYMADRDRVNSLKGGVSSTLAALWRAPIYTTGSYIAQSADTFVGMAIGGGIGGLASKGTQAVVNGIMGNTMRQLGRAAIAGDSAAAASAVASAVPRIRWATITGETIGSGLGAGYNVGAMNVAGDAQAAASRSVDELISDPEFAKFYASQPDSVLTSGVMPVMATLSGSADSRLPELQSLVAGLTLNPVDASGQPRALTADEKRQILAFYDNPLVQQAIDSGDAQSDLISKYRTHIYNRTWNNNLGRDVAVGAVEGMFSPIAGGIFKGGMGGVSSLLTRHINNKLAKAGLSTAYVLGEGGATEGIEQVVSNIGMNEAQGRDPYENWQRNVGESVVSGAIISGVLATPNAIVAMARHSPKPEKPADGSTPAEDAAPPSGGTPTGGSGFGQFNSSVYTDASNLDSDIYNRAAATASQLRDDLEVRRASDPKAVVQPADSPVFHDADGNEVTVPASALDEDIAAVQNAQTRLKQQRGEAEKNGADKAQLDKMDATIREQQNVLNTLRAARRYYKAPQGQTGAQTQQTQTQTQTGAQTQTQQAQTGGQTQTGDQTQAEQPKPKFKPGRWKASREVKNGKVTPITPTAEQQAMLDKLNAHDKGKFTWEAVGDHEFVRRGSGKKVHIFNTDYLTFNDDGSYEFSTVKDITDDQRKLWEAYRKHKKLSHNTHVDGYFDENGQLTGIAWGLAGKGAGRGGEASFTQMEQTLRDAGVDWKGSDTAQAQEESAQAQEESAQQESAQPEVQSEAQTQTQEESAPPEAQTETEETAEETAEDEQTEDEQTEDDSVPAVPSAQQAFDDALAAFDPENEGSVDPLLDATQALIDDIVAQNNGVFDPDVRYATSEADEEDHTDPKAQLREVYAKLDKALLRLEPSGIRLGYVAKATKSWLADARARQMMFHLARTLHTKTKAKSPDYFAFDLLSQFVFNSSDMLDSIDKYRVQMGDEFVDAVKMVAPVWKKSGKFNDVRAFRGAPVRSWRDIAQNVIYTIAPEAKPAPQTQPVAPQTQPEQSALDRLKSNEAFKKLNPELQKYLLDENHKLTQGDWVALASTAGLSANESATLIPLVGDVESAAKAVEGIAATTGFLRFLKKIGYKLDETYETQIKNEDEANAKAKRQAEAEAKKKEEEAKLQSMLMPEDEQTGDWGNYNSKLRRADHVVPVHEGLSVDLTGGAENSVPVQQMTDKPMKRSELRARELNADSNVHATIYTKSGTGKDRLIAVPFEEDAANSKLISENPKRLADWLNMKLPDGAVWAKGYSPLDVLIAFFGQISSGKKPKAGTKYYLKYYKGLTYQSIPIPAGGIGESSTGGSVYANKIKDSGGINGLPALYAGLIQELISINNHIAADHKGSFNSDVLQSDPVVIEADDAVIVIGVESGIGQPYSGTVLISKDAARKEGMLPESDPADVQQEQAEPTAGSAVQVSDEAREQIRYYVKQGKPVPDGVKTAYNLTDDIINTVVNEEGLNGTEYQEGQAGTDGTDNADSRQESGESTSETGSENSGSAGRTGEAAESTGNVGTGAQSTGTPESPASPAGEVSAAEQGDGESSVLSNAAPASQTAGTGTGVAPDEGGERKESPSDEADAGESAEPADGSKPSVDSGNGEAQLQQTSEELAKVALAEKALKYYNDHTGLRRSTVRSAIADALDSQGKLLAKLPAGYKDIVLDTLTDAVLNVMNSFRTLSEFIGEASPLLIQFGKEAKYEPDVNRITIPVATALKMTMPAAQKVFGKFTHDPDSDTFVYAKQTYDKADVLKDLLPAMLHAFMWHECAHALFHGVHYNRYNLSAPLRNAIDSTVDQFIRATGIKLPEGHENWARDEIFATGMEMAVLYMRSGNTFATQVVALLTDRFVKAMPDLSRLVCAIYEPFNYLPYGSYSLKRAIELMNGPLEMLYNGTDKRLMGLDEDSMRIAWKILFARNPEAVNRYVQLLSFMSGEMLNKHNALTYALNTISGMTNSDEPMAGWLLDDRYAMAILRPHVSPDNSALGEAKITIANALNLSLRDLELLVPDIDQRINDDIAMARRLKSETEQYAALATNQSDFNAMCNELESALLSGIDADTGAAAQAKPNSQLEQNGAASSTPAQEQHSQFEEDKTQGEREKVSETVNNAVAANELGKDKSDSEQAAEDKAAELNKGAVSAINENGAPLNLSLTSPYIQEITDSINAAMDKCASSTQYMQLKFMLNIWRDLIRLYGDWLGQNLLRGDVSSNDLRHILDERLDYARYHSNEHYSDAQVRLMAAWLNRFITDSELGSAIKQAYTGKDWERDDNVIIENSDGTRKVEERQFLSNFHSETISRVEAAKAAKAAAAKAEAAKAAAEAAKAAADAKARALTPDEISEELEKPAPLSPREQQDWKLETELDDQLNIFNRPNKKDTDDGVEDAEDPVGHTNADIDENSAAVKVAAYLRMTTGDENDEAVSQWLGFLFENGWGLKKLLLAKTHNKETLHMTLADFRQVMLDGEIDADVVEKIIYALDNYTNLFAIIETHHPDFRTAPANKQLGKYLGDYAESDRIQNLSDRNDEIEDYDDIKENIISDTSSIIDNVYTIDTSITAEDETDTDSNDTDSGVRYYASEADDMTEDEAQQTVDESTASEPDPEIPEDKSEAVDELLDDDSGQTQQTGAQSAQDDEDSSETGTTIDPDAPETNGRLDITFSEVLDQYFTPDEQKQMTPDLAKAVAKLDRVVKTYGVYRRAFMEQMRNAFDASRIFRENRYVRNYMNHFIDNWDRSVASLETWTIENYQGKVAPEDNPVLQSILLARRIGSSFTEAVNDILQRGMTMNENGARVRMLDANGQPVESVLDATTRMYNKLRDLGLRRDVLDTKENFRKDIGMFRTLLHTIERNEFKHEELKQQFAQLTADYNKAAQDGTPESREAAGELLKKRDELKADILHFEKMMKAESFDDVELGSKYTMPMGGRTNAMARKELDELYKKYDSALKDAGVKDAAERQQVLHEMIVSFNVAYQHAIEEMDLLSARSGFFSEHTILQRHGFKYYTPLRQDIGDGRGSTIKAAEGSTIPAVDAITNYAMEAIRRTGAVTRNVIGMALNDAYQNLHDDYEATRADANATPEEKMRNISHQSIGEAKSFNGLLRLTGEDMSRMELDKKNGKWTSKDEDRFNRFKKQAIFVELVRPTTDEERAAGLMDDTQLERMWIGFDPDIIGRARKSAPSSKSVSQQTTDLHGIQNGYDDPEKPGYTLYPEVLPRDYSDAGKALVDIAYEPSAKMGNFLKTCGFLTRAASEAMTTFNPLFALKSAVSDFRERVTRLGHKEFSDSNGKKVSGVRIALRMWRNMLNPKFLGTVGKYSIELAAHKETKNDTQYRKYLSEMHRLGIIGGVQQQMVATGGSRRSLFGMNATERINREIERANAEREAQIAEDAKTFVSKLFKLFGQFAHGVARTRIGKFLHAVHNGAVGWSNMFYNVPLAAQYIAMRECGLSERAAAADTARAMDFTNRGYYHKVGGKFISFLTSITHGTANMLDSYGLNRNLISSNKYAKKETGYVRRMLVQSYAFKAARLSAYIGLIQVLMYAVGACLRPDEPDKRKAGQQLIDNMPLSSMYFLPAPILQWLGVSDPDGFVFKLTGGFGEDRLALNLAWGLDRYSRGKATMSEVAGSYIVNFTSNATPFNMPSFDPLKNPARFAAYTAGHAIPLVSWCTDAALNITYTGRTLDGEFGPAMGQRAYEERNAYVDIAYKDLSKTLYDTLGMNISPSVLKSMYEGIGYGPVVQGIMQFVLHINDEVPRSELDPNWTSANLNVIQKFMGAASLGNKMPEKAYVFNKTMRDYYEGQFVAAGVSALLKAEGSGTKSAAIQQTMRMMGYTPAEIADRVNLNELDNKLKKILKQENNLIELRRFNGISVDQFKKRMNVLSRTANKLETDFMKSSYYYRGVYGKRAGIPDKYRARLERENRLRAIERANKELDK